MRWLFGMVAAIALFGTSGCQNQDSGSSDPGLDLTGCWGCPGPNRDRPEAEFVADVGGEVNRFRILWEVEGVATEGGVFGDFRFRPGSGAGCSAFNRSLSGTIRGTELIAILRLGSSDTIKIVVEFSDPNYGFGTYEYLETTNTCLGSLTGTVEMVRTIPI